MQRPRTDIADIDRQIEEARQARDEAGEQIFQISANELPSEERNVRVDAQRVLQSELQAQLDQLKEAKEACISIVHSDGLGACLAL